MFDFYPGHSIKKGLSDIAKIHNGHFRLTANKNLIIASVVDSEKKIIENLARYHGFIDDGFSAQRQNSMACVSFPTCPLAMAESERFLPSLVTYFEKIMKKNSVGGEHIVLRVTGCKNGCGRALLAEIGLVGKAIGRYNLYLGGNREGTRIPNIYRENIKEGKIIKEIDRLISIWAKKRTRKEGFGDFTIRTGIIKLSGKFAHNFCKEKFFQ